MLIASPSKLTASQIFKQRFKPKSVEKEVTRKFSLKDGKGIDKINIEKFEEKKSENVKIISTKCLNGDYKFSPYLEKLKLKGKNKIPRVISIATIRDKVVLSLLKDVLHQAFPECKNTMLPNAYIREIKSFNFNVDLDKVNFIKVDIEKFFPTIKHDLLIKILKKRIRSKKILYLIASAITNPTVCIGYKRADRIKLKNKEGVPQGLSISNILANIYLLEFDNNLIFKEFRYIRYVDDILMISSTLNHEQLYELVLKETTNLKLELNPDKKVKGFLCDEYEYLGYKFKNELITVRHSTVNIFIQKLASKFTWFNYRLNDKSLPKWVKKDTNLLKNRFIDSINQKITGAIDEKKKYGWIFYFIEINDLQLLYHLDLIINNFFKRQKAFDYKKPEDIKSFVKSYYQARHNPTSGYIHNYNNFDTKAKKEDLLKSFGILDPALAYSETEINIHYNKFKFDNIYELDLDVGQLY